MNARRAVAVGRGRWWRALLPALVVLIAPVAPAMAKGSIRGLLIGVDSYSQLPHLRGAVADARDLERSLTALGARKVDVLFDGEATRAGVLDRLERLSRAVGPDDLVFLSLAGAGGQASPRDENAFYLRDFDPRGGPAASELIRFSEVVGYVRRIELAGARAVVVADTCFGGVRARSVDSRAVDLSYRCKETSAGDGALAAKAAGGASRETADFKRSVLLFAASRGLRAPELRISGVGYRGALSYATARALDGAADVNGDGVITAAELFDYVRQTVHQLSDQRQQALLASPAALSPQSPLARLATRGVSVRPIQNDADDGLTIVAVDEDGKALGQAPSDFAPSTSELKSADGPSSAPAPGARPRIATGPIRIASLDGNSARLANLQKDQPVVVVDAKASPDLIWDSRTLDVLAGRDVVAHNVSVEDLPGVVDQALALAWLKQRGAQASQPVKLLPGDQLHTKGTRIEISVDQLSERFLVLFNLSGNGSAQLLYPLGSDPPQRFEPTYSVAFQVREPFGADHVVAVTSSKPLTELERTLRQSPRRLTAERLVSSLRGADVRIGFVGLFTSP